MAVAAHYVNVYGNRFGEFPNSALKNKDGTDKSSFDHIVTWLKDAGGVFRELQLLDRICKVASMALQEMGSETAEFFRELSSKLSLSWAMLTIPRLPAVTQSAWKAVADWRAPQFGPVVSQTRAALQRIHDVAEALAAYGYAAALVLGHSTFKTLADIPDAVCGITDLTMACEDYHEAQRHLACVRWKDPAAATIQLRFEDTMREAFLRIVKSVASVVNGVLGLLVLAFGGPVLPPAALLAISLTSTVAAIANHFFKETRPQKLVQFFEPRLPEVRVGGALVY